MHLLTANTLLNSFECKIILDSFTRINQTEHFTNKIRLFFYDTSYTLNIYVITRL